ncbi:MAG: NAD-dependent epimerase/dehydratase family protein, partial [Acetobacterales bacterium]
GASVGRSVDDPEADRIRTVDATLALIRVLTRAAPGAHLILPSSAAVYGDVSPSSVDEAQPRAPVSPYGMHKALCEELCEQAHADAGIPVSIVRFFSLYGSGLRKQLLWDLCCRLNRLEREVTLFGTGAESRDWMHVSDAAELVAALAKAPAGFRLLNGGTGLATTVRDVATMIIRMMDSRAPLSFNRRRRPGDPAHLVADIAALDAFGFRPRIRLTEGAAEYVSWYRNVESAGGPGALVTPVPA